MTTENCAMRKTRNATGGAASSRCAFYVSARRWTGNTPPLVESSSATLNSFQGETYLGCA
jgi:hypothetical protein